MSFPRLRRILQEIYTNMTELEWDDIPTVLVSWVSVPNSTQSWKLPGDWKNLGLVRSMILIGRTWAHTTTVDTCMCTEEQLSNNYCCHRWSGIVLILLIWPIFHLCIKVINFYSGLLKTGCRSSVLGRKVVSLSSEEADFIYTFRSIRDALYL